MIIYIKIYVTLDEDYKNFANNNEKATYVAMLTSLFKAVQYIRRYVKREERVIRAVKDATTKKCQRPV